MSESLSPTPETNPANEPNPITGALVAYLRTQRKLTGRSLATSSGVSTSYVSKLESGTLEPSLRTFARIAVTLNLTPLEVWAIVRWEAARGVPVTPPAYSDPSLTSVEVGDDGAL